MESMVDSAKECPVCTGTPSVVVAIAHPALRRLILDLFERDCVRWQLHAASDRRDLPAIVGAAGPDLVVLDDHEISWSPALAAVVAPQRVIVIGPDPDPAYERAARRAGAGAWLCRDRVGEDLIPSMRSVLGCTHDPTLPAPVERLRA